MDGFLAGKVVLVTGGASGIGRASALACAQAGGRVVVADVATDGGAETIGLIRDAGGDGYFVAADVSRSADVAMLVERIVDVHGRLDCAHNNAGIEGALAPTPDGDEDNWDRVLTVNLKSVWLCMKYEIPQMVGQHGGSIVNTASVAGLVGMAGLSAYTASKGGVIQLTRTAAVEYAAAGVRVNAVCPGIIRTPMVERQFGSLIDDDAGAQQIAAIQPMARMGAPTEVAEAVVWLLSDRASFVTGHPLVVDGGLVAR